MGSGKLKPSSCPALPSPSWLKQEDRAAGEAQGMAEVEHASSEDPAPHWSRFVMPWMAFCSIVEYQKFFVVVQVMWPLCWAVNRGFYLEKSSPYLGGGTRPQQSKGCNLETSDCNLHVSGKNEMGDLLHKNETVWEMEKELPLQCGQDVLYLEVVVTDASFYMLLHWPWLRQNEIIYLSP